MERNSSPCDAKESETSNSLSVNLDEHNKPSFEENCSNICVPDFKRSSEPTKIDKITSKLKSKNKKRLRNQQVSKIFKRQSLSPDVSVSEATVEPNSESCGLLGREVDLYGSVLDKRGSLEIMEHLSPLPSMEQDESNDATLCTNDLSNDSNLCSDTAINESMYTEHGLNDANMYSDTGMAESEQMDASQVYTNTGPCVNNDIDLNPPNNPSLVGINTNPSQGFDLLQNMHYDTNSTNRLPSQNNYGGTVNTLDDGAGGNINMTQMNQLSNPYMYPYNASPQGDNSEYMEYNGHMGFSPVGEYTLEGLGYMMDANYSNDNTNLESNNNYDPNNVFINNLDNLTQSQDHLSNTHTVSNYNAGPEEMDGMVGIEDLSNDADQELIRNNSINALIENAEKNFDPEAMNSILRDLVCPICFEYFYFPVTVACGHTFCRYCIGHSKLSGKVCPLCRQPIGRSLNINTILSNLVKSLKLRKRGYATLSRAPDVSQVAEKVWWDEHCLKPFVSVPLFIRIMFGEIAQAPVFFDDLCSCLIDYFNTGNRWYKSKWVFTIEDFRLIRNLIGLQLQTPNSGGSQTGDMGGTDPMGSTVNDTNNVRLHHWVEDYLIANPQLCFRSDVMYPLTLKVYHDVNHKIEGTIFSALDIPYKLPWDAGRHAKSLLHLPHSSVSLSHLIFAQCPNGQFGILDVGSTIGTMIKLQGVHVLQSGDRIHIGDKHEVDVHITKGNTGNPFKDYMWDTSINQVINYTEYANANATNTPDQSLGGENSATMGEDDRNVDVDMDANNKNNLVELDSFLKLRIFADLQVERDVWICPKGVILGRGPVTQSSYKKLSITTQNGYISREHCLIYYDGSRPSGSRWLLRDMSTLGTFLKLKPFQEPLPVAPGFVFKVGQCKVEVGSPHELSRRVPSSATLILSQLLHSHIEPYRLVELQSNANNQVNPISQLVGPMPGADPAQRLPHNVAEPVRLEPRRERDTYRRIQMDAMANAYMARPDLPDDVDPNGQVVPDSLRDEVL